MFGLGFPELLIILLIILVIFGAGKLPQVGDALGKGLSKFRSAMNEKPAESDQVVKSDSHQSMDKDLPPKNVAAKKKVKT